MEGWDRLITSREYKLMLHADRFADREEGARAFWDLIESTVAGLGGEVVKRQNKKLTRQTWYLDTEDWSLRQHGSALRLRKEQSGKPKYKITLKYRGPDRCVSGYQDMSVSDEVAEKNKSEGGKAEIKWKFEEDILPAFISRFAHSVSIKTANYQKLETMDDVLGNFPGLDALDIPRDTSVDTVCRFYAHEVVLRVGQVEFDGKPKVKFCLSFWYPSDKENAPPLVAECSFDYDVPESTSEGQDRLERFPFEVVKGANGLFRALQKQSDWINFNATTKTACAYERCG
jgi:CYTH domain-containing protein